MSARFVIELELEDGAGWSATMPDEPTFPREYQGLAATNHMTPSAALLGLANALVAAAELRLVDDLDAAGSPAKVSDLFPELGS